MQRHANFFFPKSQKQIDFTFKKTIYKEGTPDVQIGQLNILLLDIVKYIQRRRV